jgi:hypothetical protein
VPEKRENLSGDWESKGASASWLVTNQALLIGVRQKRKSLKLESEFRVVIDGNFTRQLDTSESGKLSVHLGRNLAESDAFCCPSA